MFWLRQALVPTRDFDATVKFYSQILGQPGVRLAPHMHEFDIENIRLRCVKVGGHEHNAQPTALEIYSDNPPAAANIERAGGRTAESSDFPFPPSPGQEAQFAFDPSGNVICFSRPQQEDLVAC